MKPVSFILLLCLSLNAPKELLAQRFKAGLIFGLNASQLDGDNSAGFNKIGLQGGVRGVSILGPKSQLSLELLFSQRGSRTELVANNAIEPRKIHLDYVEVPVVFNYLDWLSEEGFYKFHFSAGLSYGRLLRVRIQDDFYDGLADEFNRNDVGLLAGATFYVNKNLGFTVRYNRSIVLLFNNDNSANFNANSLLGYFLSFQAVYMF